MSLEKQVNEKTLSVICGNCFKREQEADLNHMKYREVYKFYYFSFS